MSLLQCIGCRTRRTISRYSTSPSPVQSQNIGNASNRDRSYAVDNGASAQVNGTTARLLDKARRLFVRQFSNSMTSSHNASQSTGQHEERPVTALNDPVKLTTRLTQLRKRLARYEESLSKMSPNTPEYATRQSQRNHTVQQIGLIRRKIAVL